MGPFPVLQIENSTCWSTPHFLLLIVGFSSHLPRRPQLQDLIDTKPDLDVMNLAQVSASQSRPLAQARRVPAQARRTVVARAQQRQILAQIAGAAAAASLLLVRVAWCLITMHKISVLSY